MGSSVWGNRGLWRPTQGTGVRRRDAQGLEGRELVLRERSLDVASQVELAVPTDSPGTARHPALPGRPGTPGPRKRAQEPHPPHPV